MEWITILQPLLQTLLIALLTAAEGFVIYYVRKKIAESKAQSNSQLTANYLGILEDVVIDCIRATNQTYVNTLKSENAFTEEAQQEALYRTFEAVMNVLTDEAKEHLGKCPGGIETLVIEKIEANIEKAKQ